MSIIDRARQMVCQMNEYEAHKKRLPELSVQDWPEWAQRDFRLACAAMVTVRSEALVEGQAAGRKALEELAYLSRNRTTTRITLRDRIASLLPNVQDELPGQVARSMRQHDP